jgi:hypothetical protein
MNVTTLDFLPGNVVGKYFSAEILV